MDKTFNLQAQQTMYRMATPQDAAGVRAIAEYYIKRTTASWRYEVMDEAGYAAMIRSHQKPTRPFWVAVQNDQIVGYSYLTDFRAPEGYWPCAENSIYVHPDYLKAGIGTRLMKLLIDSARTARLKAIIATIDGENQQSIDFHKRFGFYECGRLNQIGWKHNSFRDMVIMQLDLDE